MAEPYKNPYGDNLLDAIISGIKSTLGTAQSDIAKIKSGEMPNDLMSLLMEGLQEAPIGKFAGKAGSVAKGILGPIGRATSEALGSAGAAKSVNQAQKKIVKALFRGDPATLKEVVGSPRMMHVGVPGAGVKVDATTKNLADDVMQGAFAHFQPGGSMGGTIRMHPNVMRGKDVRKFTDPPRFVGGKIIPGRDLPPRTLKSQGIEGLPDMAVHEATHFLNEPALGGGTHPLDPNMGRLANALIPFIGHANFGQGIVDKKLMQRNNPLALNEALSYLAQPSGRSPGATFLQNALTKRPQTAGIADFHPETRNLLQEALDAALRVPQVIRNTEAPLPLNEAIEALMRSK